MDHLQYAEARLQVLDGEVRGAVNAFKKYEGEVRVALQELFKSAGIANEVATFEKEVAQARAKLQEKLKALDNEASDLRKVIAFLKERPQVPSELAPLPADPAGSETNAASVEAAPTEVEDSSSQTPAPIYSKPRPVAPF